MSKDILDGYMSPEGAEHFDKDGIFDNFTADADRSYHTINGKALDKDKKAVEDGFKDAVKDIRHRKALSCFMSQMSQGTVINMSNRFDEYVDVMKLEGAEKQEFFFDLKGDMPVLTDARIIQELDAGAGNEPAGPNPPAEA